MNMKRTAREEPFYWASSGDLVLESGPISQHVNANVRTGCNAEESERLQESGAVKVSGSSWLHALNPPLVTR